ncbi:MAG: trypsin-like peptidase domain-containing protein [Muricauda sp.]|nr:serine protease [Allomuricauda sp.]MBO6830091.1 trypsin-like peptidase domain-containing protein [Allomuricauda sp.]
MIWKVNVFWKIIIALFFNVQLINGQDRTVTRIESVQSLYIEVFKDDVILGKATGFIVKSKTQNYLITNWHVVTNKDSKTGLWLNPKKPISPNKVKILHNSTTLGNYSIKEEKITDDKGRKLFKDFTFGNKIVDVVAIPLKDTISDVKLYPVDYTKTSDSLVVMPTDRVFILGFPKGFRSAPAFPVWKSGLIASEPDIDQEGKPIIWVDLIGYPGMSGSPVYLITDKLTYKNGDSAQLFGGKESFFMGVFSHGYMDISTGALWKGTYLKTLFDSLD